MATTLTLMDLAGAIALLLWGVHMEAWCRDRAVVLKRWVT